MVAEYGHFALICAWCLALLQTMFPLLGLWRKQTTWIALAKPTAYGQLFFVLIAFACLVYAFISNDFSVVYVAENSNTQLPWVYRIAAVWGAHEGSILLWITILSVWTSAVALLNKRLPADMLASIVAILGLLSVGFLSFLLLTSNPFQRFLVNVPRDGADLNPLLQDPGLAMHPPILYLGYVGFAVAFAFAIAILLKGHLDAMWARAIRPWVIASWCFLTLGITFGSWWAYRELGWGGWWFWDPVENASFLPWLIATALIHSLMVTERQETLKSWTVLLAIGVFSLSLLGTFLVRSGILISVHAFANDPSRGIFLLEFLAAVIGGALLLYAWRAPLLRSTGNYFTVISRETLVLGNNLLLVVAMATILLGTLYPLILDALGIAKISVGAPYFNAVFVPLMVPLLLLMGIAPLCYWGTMQGHVLLQRVFFLMLLTTLITVLLMFFIKTKMPLGVIVGLFLASWIIIATLQSVVVHAYKQRSITRLPLRQLAMLFAHIGVAVCVIGITITSHYQTSREVSMQPGDKVIIADYTLQFLGVKALHGANYHGETGAFEVGRGNTSIGVLHTEKRFYDTQQTAITKVAINANLWRDIYVALGDPLADHAWSVRIYYKPFVRWIWLGGFLIFIGGIIALLHSRRIH